MGRLEVSVTLASRHGPVNSGNGFIIIAMESNQGTHEWLSFLVNFILNEVLGKKTCVVNVENISHIWYCMYVPHEEFFTLREDEITGLARQFHSKVVVCGYLVL